jgi:hypothetical protein
MGSSTLPDKPDTIYVHVHQMNIRRNQDDGGTRPVFVVIHGVDGSVEHSNYLHFTGPSTLVYRPEAPLNGGTRAWFETKHPVAMIDSWSDSND